MKKLILSLILTISFISCTKMPVKQESCSRDSIILLLDSISTLNESLKICDSNNASLFQSIKNSKDTIQMLYDSIFYLNRKPIMNEKQFIEIYKYETIKRYYDICRKKPSQYKYFKGWVIRTIEQ